MLEFKELWNTPGVPAYWLMVAWMLSAAGWALMTLLWGAQTLMAAQSSRWPAMYIHAFKTLGAVTTTTFFVLSILWRDAVGLITWGAFSRNLVGGMIVLALFIEACWRLKEITKLRAKGVLA